MPRAKYRLLTSGEVASVLGVSVPTVRRLLRAGELTAIPLPRHYSDERPRVAARWRIDPESVAACVERASRKTPNPRTFKGIRKALGLKVR